jgi:gliding motility-associated-like protein
MLNVDQSGTYWVEVQNQCGSVQDTVEITMLPAVDDFDLGRDTAICQGEMLLLDGPLTPWDYQWQDGSSGTAIVVDASGQYWLQISNRCGIASDTIHVTVNDETPRDFPAERIAVCAGEAVLLNAQQPFDAFYRWNTGDTTPTLETDLAGIYTVAITSKCMQASAQYFVEEKQCAEEVFIPNVFSPNGDAVNDLFEVLLAPSLDVVHAECSVFDRWGNHLFHTEQEEISWDGTFRNETVAPGVYVYVVIIDAQKNGRAHREVYKGDVTVVR